MKLFSISLVFILSLSVWAQSALINEVLFSLAGQASTSRDQQVYEAVLSQVFQKSKLSEFSQKSTSDFLLSRLSYKEAVAFELTGQPVKLTDALRKKMPEYSVNEIEREIDVISKALVLIEVKETQLKQQERFDNWVDVLKRKYQVKLKSSEIK